MLNKPNLTSSAEMVCRTTISAIKKPTFVIFCNNTELFHFSYQRYIENCLRNTFGFKGTPIRLIIRMKGDESV